MKSTLNHFDLLSADLNLLSLKQLIDILYELDWLGSWDLDEEGQEPITKEEAIFYIKNMLVEY